ncbi:anaphase-promoting complex subunit 15 [Sabethes cyaneus]|uniref:anaphase-promoting complex subunit 15 n=1 Tax=Sabethes cyaneus TaxID=53552 RepID=UPI00237D58AE|nr:anaphase-promoting complex subunit 15 [Sabethes cyaneus]
MLPFFPSLRPAVANNLWFAVDECCDEDAEVNAMESEHQEWLNRMSQIGADLAPIGKDTNEHADNMDSEDDDANDESDDSDNSDEDDEDMEDIANVARPNERLVMEPTYNNMDDELQTNDPL